MNSINNGASQLSSINPSQYSSFNTRNTTNLRNNSTGFTRTQDNNQLLLLLVNLLMKLVTALGGHGLNEKPTTNQSNENSNFDRNNNSGSNQFDLVSIAPPNIANSTSFIPNPDAPVAVDINRDGQFSGGDILVDRANGTAHRVDYVQQDPMIIDNLNGLNQIREQQMSHIASLSDDQLSALQDQTSDDQFDLVSTAPASIANSPGFTPNPDAPVAIDVNKDGKFSGGDILIDSTNGTALRVDHVQQEPIFGLNSLFQQRSESRASRIPLEGSNILRGYQADSIFPKR